jgi:phage tail sheath protein FI
MATYTYPGVYIQEVPKGPGPVQAASASTCAMVGFTEEGLVNEPTLVTSFPEFTSKFGSFTTKGRLPTAAFAYFQNGGQNLIVVRTVGAGALTATGIVDGPVAGLDVALDPAPDGVIRNFAIDLAESPIVAGSVSFTAGGLNYTDDGAGAIVDAANAKRGSIDYVTGEITLTALVAIAANAPNASMTYEYVNVMFTASSPGDWANDLSVMIAGDENSVVANEYTAYIVTVQRLDADGRPVDVEVFNDISFDRNSANFIETRLNDERRGSDLVVVSTGSNVSTPAELDDVSTSETLAPVGVLDGANKAFELNLTQAPVRRDTFRAEWNVASAESFGAINNGQVTRAVRDVQNESNMTVIVTSSTGQTENFAVTQTGTAGTAIVENFTIQPGDAVDFLNGTFTLTNAATGAWTMVQTAQGTGNPTIASIEIRYVRATPLVLEDDGLGEVTRTSGDADVTLVPAGPNTIDYTTGEVNIVVDVGGNGPLGLVGGSQVSVNYTSVNAATSFSTPLAGGTDGAGLLRSNVSAPALAGSEEGLFALNRREELLNVCIPDFADNELVSQDLIDYCETRKDRFAIISVPEGYSYTEAIDYKRNTLLRNSNRAAIYYPHLKIVDPVTENEINFPAVAHMAGIYARTDSVRNVSKAPAGTTDGRIAFATGLEIELTPQQAGFVNQANVNNLVAWPYTGLVAWGARTLETNGDFPYIQMRRLFMFVEKSVFNSTQGFVFESNTAALRSAIKLQIEAFLLSLHRSGHFAGNSPAQSFFVICDSSNNTQTAIDQGQLVVDVGIAPTKPAEFVIFRFQQKTVD